MRDGPQIGEMEDKQPDLTPFVNFQRSVPQKKRILRSCVE